MKKNMANISFAQSVITKSLTISQQKHKRDADLNLKQSHEYAKKCIDRLTELYGEDSEQVLYAQEQLYHTDEDDRQVEHYESPSHRNQSWN